LASEPTCFEGKIPEAKPDDPCSTGNIAADYGEKIVIASAARLIDDHRHFWRNTTTTAEIKGASVADAHPPHEVGDVPGQFTVLFSPFSMPTTPCGKRNRRIYPGKQRHAQGSHPTDVGLGFT
jgi:hypothetical protein